MLAGEQSAHLTRQFSDAVVRVWLNPGVSESGIREVADVLNDPNITQGRDAVARLISGGMTPFVSSVGSEIRREI